METVIISIGGSVISPQEININFLKKLKIIITKFVNRGNRVVMVAGGGSICREYQEAALNISKIKSEDLDWIGITATKLNAELLRLVFSDKAYEVVINNPTKKIKTKKKIIIGSGWKPGFSSDMDAVLFAVNLKADTVINVSNIDYVYDKNPNKFKDAKKLENLSWQEMFKIVGTKWKPGMHAPFDPEASKLCQKKGIKVFVLNGNRPDNFAKALNGQKFKGTIIE